MYEKLAAAIVTIALFGAVYFMLGTKHFAFKHGAFDAWYLSMNVTSTVGMSNIDIKTRTGKLVVMAHQFVVLMGVFATIGSFVDRTIESLA